MRGIKRGETNWSKRRSDSKKLDRQQRHTACGHSYFNIQHVVQVDMRTLRRGFTAQWKARRSRHVLGQHHRVWWVMGTSASAGIEQKISHRFSDPRQFGWYCISQRKAAQISPCSVGEESESILSNGLCEKGARLAALDHDSSRRLGAILDGDRAVSLLGVHLAVLPPND